MIALSKGRGKGSTASTDGDGPRPKAEPAAATTQAPAVPAELAAATESTATDAGSSSAELRLVPLAGRQPAFFSPGLELAKGRGKGSKASTDGDGPAAGVTTACVGATVLGSSAVWHGMRAISTTSAVFEDFVITSGVAAETVSEAGSGEAAILFRRTVRTLYYAAVLFLAITTLWKWRSSAISALGAIKGLTSKSSACIEGDGPRWSRTPTAPAALEWAWAPATPAAATPPAASSDDLARWADLRREVSRESVSERLAGTRLSNARKLAGVADITATLTPLGFAATVISETGVRSEANALSSMLLEASCSCLDYGRHGPLCKRGGSVLLALCQGQLPSERQVLRGTPNTSASSASNLGSVLRELRDSEAELLATQNQLRKSSEDLKELRSRTATTTQHLDILDASESQQRRLAAIRTAKSFVYVVAFTYDLDDVTQSIIEAKRTRPTLDIRVLLDREQALTGPTRNLRPRVIQLTTHRIAVRLYSERRLHAKVLLTDVEQIWGSSNWTNASLMNVERCAITTLPEASLNREKAWFDDLWNKGRVFSGREQRDDLRTPPVRDV